MTINFPPSFAKSWKTTLAGVVSLFIGAMQGYNDATFSIALHDPRVQMAVVLGILGLVAKDSNVSGGTIAQPSSAEVVEASKTPKETK